MRLREMREDHDYSQQKLAEILHVKQNTYSQYETGRRQIPISLLIQLADLYNTSIDYLLGRTNTKKFR